MPLIFHAGRYIIIYATVLATQANSFHRKSAFLTPVVLNLNEARKKLKII